MAGNRIRVCVWNDRDEIFYPISFSHRPDPSNWTNVLFTAEFRTKWNVTHWGWHNKETGLFHREPLPRVVHGSRWPMRLTLESGIGLA